MGEAIKATRVLFWFGVGCAEVAICGKSRIAADRLRAMPCGPYGLVKWGDDA